MCKKKLSQPVQPKILEKISPFPKKHHDASKMNPTDAAAAVPQQGGLQQPQQPPPHQAPPQPPMQPVQPPAFPPPPVPVAPRPEDAATHITVSDPVQHQDGMSKFTSYRVDVRPPDELNPGGGAGGMGPDGTPGGPGALGLSESIFANATYSAVLRRYSDFLWLYERLHRERAGAIIPPLPEKQAVSRFTPAFIEQRRSDLEVFLRRVAVHPELRDAACLDTFLRADEASFRAAKSMKDGGGGMPPMDMSASGYNMGGGGMPMGSPSAEKKIKSWFSETKTSISGDLVRSPDDDLFDEIERYVAGLDSQMRAVSTQATGLVRKGKELANGMFEFGLAFHLLGRSEQEVLGSALNKVGDAADAISVLNAEHADLEAARFEAPLQDYVKTIHAVRLALTRRHERRLAYTARLSELNAKQASLIKLRSTPGQEAKAYAAEMSLQRGQAAADAARDDFMAVSQRVLREVDRFKREKAEDMKRTVYQYIEMQIDYNRKMETIWADLIPVLENVPLRDDQVAGAGGDVPTPTPVSLPNDAIPGAQTQQPPAQQQQATAPPQQQAMPPAAAPPPVPPQADQANTPSSPDGAIMDVPLGDPMMGSGIQYRT